MTAHPCQIEVAQPYVDASGTKRARWVRHGSASLTSAEASERAKELKEQHGAARITCPVFEVVALRKSFGLKLIEGDGASTAS